MKNHSYGKYQIVILGDEQKSAVALKRVLETTGYRALIATSVESAYSQISTNLTSLFIIESSASKVTGQLTPTHLDEPSSTLWKLDWAKRALELIKDLRSYSIPAEFPILVITKTQNSKDKVAWLEAGATAILAKPYTKGELISRVKSLVKSWGEDIEKSEKFEQLNILHSVSTVLASSLDPDVLLQGTLKVLVNDFHADAGVIYQRNPLSQSVNLAAHYGFEFNDREMEGCLIDFYFGTAFSIQDTPFILHDIPESSCIKRLGEPLSQLRTLICAPFGINGSITGAICLFSNSPQGFLKQNAGLLSTICNQLSIALENARLYIETKKSASQLSFVYNLGNNLMTSLELDQLLSYAVFSVGKALACDVCAVIIKQEDNLEHLAAAKYSRVQSEGANKENWFDSAKVKNFLEKIEPNNLQPSIEIRISEKILKDKNISLETIATLEFDGTILGMVVCGSYVSRPMSSDDQRLLISVAQQLSLAIRNIELYQNSKDTSINLAVEVSARTKEIEEQKRFTEKIIDSLPVSLYVVDRDLRIVAWNRNRELGGSGISREAVLGKNVFKVLMRQPRLKLQEEFLDVFRTGKIISLEQETFEDGQKKIWKINKIPMRVDNAEVSHVITVGEDITDQKKMNEAVIHAEKLASIGRLAAGVVHEINNPLATIAACAEALLSRISDIQGDDTQVDFKEYLQIVKDEAFRCKTITNNLLEFSHQRQSEKFLCDINQIIDQTLHLVKHHPKIGKMTIVKELDDEVAPVYVNEGQMKQIFIALISNAYDSMNGDGTLTIRTKALKNPEKQVSAEFIDTGCGISSANLLKIFDPFFTTKPIGRGTGLGLSVCYGIVTDHGGKIEVDSIEGHGATFRILLPISEPAPFMSSQRLHSRPIETERVQ
ncbi:MAG: ATP-binding protein [Acidobacteriota bacterium]